MNQTVFHDSGFEHPSNQTNNSLVSYPLLEELEQPLVINAIEKATYVGFDDVVNTYFPRVPFDLSSHFRVLTCGELRLII